jgi:hypothetical protein
MAGVDYIVGADLGVLGVLRVQPESCGYTWTPRRNML